MERLAQTDLLWWCKMLSHLSIFSFCQMLSFHGRAGGKQHVPVLQLQLKRLALSLKKPKADTFSPADSAVGEQHHSKNNHNRILISQCYRLFPQLKCSGSWSSNLEMEIIVCVHFHPFFSTKRLCSAL